MIDFFGFLCVYTRIGPWGTKTEGAIMATFAVLIILGTLWMVMETIA